jgi:hypothetical protein
VSDQPTVTFEQDKPKVLCTYYTCTQGHQWTPKVALTPCAGCGAPVVVVMVQNCPVCNEPTSKLRVRTDHIPNKGGVARVCLGEPSGGDVVEVEMEREGWKETEKKQ